ncbi:hypothetical protein AACH06_18850 [Ideonella sp. DXS29W]|uniref:Uncharacterized protein n=1 Tax=Ideonella lacteola TaxID=2984193 RepID=A0ABU9BT27_9BURK
MATTPRRHHFSLTSLTPLTPLTPLRACWAARWVCAWLMVFAVSAHASGGDYEMSDSIFAPGLSVDSQALPRYGTGQLGVIQPSYRRVYLMLAWRAAQGHPLSAAEMDQLVVQGWRVQVEGTRNPYSSATAWREARKAAVARLPAGKRPRSKGLPEGSEVFGEFGGGMNCNAYAFVRAEQTLAERQKMPADQGWPAWGGLWLQQQDAVFDACTATPTAGGAPEAAPLLPPLPAGAPPWLQWDRDYQMAAIRFYRRDYQAAREAFLAIAADKASPWRVVAAYLAARSLIRATSDEFGGDAPAGGRQVNAEVREMLATARRELLQVADEYPPAHDLVGWIDMRLRPQERLKGLGAELAEGRLIPHRVGAVNDYLVWLSRLPPQTLVDAPDAMTRWIGVMQACCAPLEMPWWIDTGASQAAESLVGEPLQQRALGVARAQWRATHAPVWLVPLLSQALPPGPKVPAERLLAADERQAALAVPAESPIYLHLRYHLLRLRIAQGDTASADADIAALLADRKQPMSDATRNRFLGLKVQSAQSLADFLATAPRRIVEPMGRPLIDADRASRANPQAAAPAVGLDSDFLGPLYRHLPLATLMAIRQAPELSAERVRLTEIIWTRAALLGQWEVADALADELAQPRTTTRELWRRFKAARTPAEKRDAATVIWVNTPELNPGLALPDPQAYGQCNSVGWSVPQRDDGREGARDDAREDGGETLLWQAPAFLSAAERAQAAEQMRPLLALKDRNPALAPTLMAWAKAHPEDPEAPKALHFFVMSTRKECRRYDADRPNAPPRSHPREAFQLLHKLWPRSEWAKITKYYY